jgi:hypothetical protein
MRSGRHLLQAGSKTEAPRVSGSIDAGIRQRLRLPETVQPRRRARHGSRNQCARHPACHQTQFAAAYEFSIRTVQEWERGAKKPSGPARALSTVFPGIGRGPDRGTAGDLAPQGEQARGEALCDLPGDVPVRHRIDLTPVRRRECRAAALVKVFAAIARNQSRPRRTAQSPRRRIAPRCSPDMAMAQP